MESEDREGREGRGRTKGFGTWAGRRATRRAGRRGSRRGRLNLTFKKKEKRRKAHIVGLNSRKIIIQPVTTKSEDCLKERQYGNIIESLLKDCNWNCN